MTFLYLDIVSYGGFGNFCYYMFEKVLYTFVILTTYLNVIIPNNGFKMSQCSVSPAPFSFLFIRFPIYIFIPTVDFKQPIFKLTNCSCLSYPAIDVFFLIFNFISCILQLKNFFLPILNCLHLLWSRWSLDVFLCVFFLLLFP